MNQQRKPVMPTFTIPILEPSILEAEPEPLQIDLKRTTIMIIDVQNAFVRKGGFFDLLGRDITKNQKILDPLKKVTVAGRAKGVKVIYVAHRYSPDFHDAGSSNSPNWYKDADFYLPRENPKWRDKFLIRGTWGAEIVEEVKPEQGDIVIEKQRYSSFPGTNLDTILRSYDIKFIAFAGIATNVCVESTLRDAYFLEYFPILISDATAAAGPPFMQEATEFTVKMCFGWVTTSESIIKSME